MAEVAVFGAITLVDKLSLWLVESWFDFKRIEIEIEELRKWLNTIKVYLEDTEGREDTEGLKLRSYVRDLAFEIQDVIEDLMYEATERPRHLRQAIKFIYASMFCPSKRFSSRMKAIKCKIRSIDALCICPPHVRTVRSSSNLFLGDEHHVGIEKHIKPLLSLVCLEDSSDKVISVIGDAGSGKTTLISEVYHILNSNFNCKAWVSVSRSSDGLLEKLCEALELPHKINKLRSCLQHKRYLLVLDDIWNENEWNWIKNVLPSNNTGSRIIITTRKRSLGSYCASSSHYIYDLNLHPLTCEEAWELFCDKAFQDGKCPDFLVDWSVKIVKRCEGLPHAIVTIGKFLSNKQQSMMEFRKVHDSLQYEPDNPFSHSFYRILWPSYYRLPPNLKSCFLYFGLFPEDYSIKCGRIIRLWVAEGFIEQKRGKTLEQVAYEYLDELIQMSLVQVSRWYLDGQVRSCRVSNLVRGFILSETMKDNFFTVVSRQHTSLGGEKIRRLSLHNCSPSILQSKDLSYLRTFSLFGGDNRIESFPRSFFRKVRLLTVLDLENSALHHFPEEAVKLNLLTYLSLRNTKIDSVPKSIKKLQNLIILDLKETLVTIFPMEIVKLHKLLFLFVGGRGTYQAAVGAQVSSGIGCLTMLEKLSLIKANNKNQSIVKELGNLIHMRELGITELKVEDGKNLCASIEKMEHLCSLYVNSASKEEYLDLNYVTNSPQLINSLILGGRLEEIPAWIGKLNSLSKIQLKWSKLQSSPLEALQALPSLKELHLYDAYTGTVMEFSAECFSELKMLEIEQCNRLNKVVIQERALPKLQKLTIKKCDSLVMVHITKNFLSQLEEVLVPQDLISMIKG
ncbi:disease resistance protein RPM1-like [Quercus robur]|uniref:disease resistance protein RPM1-like n=2 Tax=Quercus robur TaxID=38942 RepID=UPI002162F60E|nr:disease resistance protein RPM1-like [Quercus robur]